MTSTGTDSLRFRHDIEGLRAAAILLVVAAHAGVPWLAGGLIGVDVFFVLSGFLITGKLVREKGRADLAEKIMQIELARSSQMKAQDTRGE